MATRYQTDIQHTPPGCTTPATSTHYNTGVSDAQCSGSIFVPIIRMIMQVIAIPFDGITSAKFFRIYNNTLHPLDLRIGINGGGRTSVGLIPAGSYFTVAQSTYSPAGGISSAEVRSVEDHPETGRVGYWIEGGEDEGPA